MSYPLLHIIYHSPTGFEYGYAGSGPADLAFSILADYYGITDKNEAVNGEPGLNHQSFKMSFLASRNRDEQFEITEEAITDWLFSRSFGSGDEENPPFTL